MLAILLLLTLAPAARTHPAGVARAQDELAAGDMSVPGQVIAQGIARLPRGDVAWTVRSIEVPGGEGTQVASFPVGFAVADGAMIAVLDADGEVLTLLADGEEAFLPNGRSGALASGQDDVASLYDVALVSGREATAGETPGTVAGSLFAAPEEDAFDIEIARTALTRDEQTTIPASRSGTPVLYLQTAGTTQLQAEGDQTVELAAGRSWATCWCAGRVTSRRHSSSRRSAGRWPRGMPQQAPRRHAPTGRIANGSVPRAMASRAPREHDGSGRSASAPRVVDPVARSRAASQRRRTQRARGPLRSAAESARLCHLALRPVDRRGAFITDFLGYCVRFVGAQDSADRVLSGSDFSADCDRIIAGTARHHWRVIPRTLLSPQG